MMDKQENEREIEWIKKTAVARIKQSMRAIFDSIRRNGESEWIDRDTGEVHYLHWPIDGIVAVMIEHSDTCLSHKYGCEHGYACTCSPEIYADLTD
jgi:hypothetical protein